MLKHYPIVIVFAMLLAAPAAAQGDDAASLAKAAQNPIADMISVPFPKHVKFDTGPGE